MSLSLVQGYESEEEAGREKPPLYSDSDDELEPESNGWRGQHEASVLPQPETTVGLAAAIAPQGETVADSALPSATDIFSEVTGPPDFLSPPALAPVPSWRSRSSASKPGVDRTGTREDHTIVAGAVLAARPQLVERGERAANPGRAQGGALAATAGAPAGGVKTFQAGMPPAEDAAHLLSVCPKCHVPKTFSAAQHGMVCPLCLDREEAADKGEKKKRGQVKDKEKNKRMKGQSAHATWKSETEMHLRQTFD